LADNEIKTCNWIEDGVVRFQEENQTFVLPQKKIINYKKNT
jgi:hypothetical protein